MRTIKLAKGASVDTESGTEGSVRAEVKVDVSGANVPVKAGPEAGWGSKKKKGISFGGSTDYIFAYQLTRIKPKASGKSSNKSYVKGAVFGKGEERDNADVKKVRDLFDIEEEVSRGFLDTLYPADDQGSN
ncbi:hypothetical protein F5X97DRAFT_329792 [Nemania serpens]|nr:hypothetical protein F5X97DRAFT_329792 [Nemania serpens]